MNMLNNKIYSATAIAPATCANVAVGFDILGFAIEGVYDEVTLTRRDDDQLVIVGIESTVDVDLPVAIEENTASVALQALLNDLNITTGFDIHIKKGIPLASGMGGSAASAVAAVVAVNAFLKRPLFTEVLLECALSGEAVASGDRHADNVAPSLLGGLTLIYSTDPLKVRQLPLPGLYCVIAHPHLLVETHVARALLGSDLPLKQYVAQSARLAGFISALYEDDHDLLRESLQDVLIEPLRAPLVPGYFDVKHAALRCGALGMGISGSGPSVFALVEGEPTAETVANEMSDAFSQHGLACDLWVSPLTHQGAKVNGTKKRER